MMAIVALEIHSYHNQKSDYDYDMIVFLEPLWPS